MPALDDGNVAPAAARFRWVICLLLFLATSINYMDRQVVAVLAKVLQEKFNWGEQEYSHVVFAFQLAYMIGLLCVGPFIQKVGLKLGYTLAIALWSAAACATAFAGSLFGFCVARFILGLGEAGNFPAATKTIAEWFPRRERSLATGLFNTGTSSGAMVAPVLVPWLANTWNWQTAFVVLGATGFLWIGLWLLLYHSPAKSPFLSPAGLAYVRSDDAPEVAATAEPGGEGARVGWFELFAHRQTWGIMISSAMVVPVMWFQVFWLPKFLNAQFHVSISQAGWPLATAFGMQFLGSIFGGILATWLISKGKSVHFARKFSLALCAFLVVPIAFVGLIPSMWPAILVVGLAMAAMQGWSANSYTVTSDLFPKRAIASMVGLGTAAGAVGSMTFAEFAGWYLARSGGNYTLLFVLAGCGFPLAIAVIHLFIPRWEPVRLKEAR
jgi:ACS family hexuronate transporter-like MFS transporter